MSDLSASLQKFDEYVNSIYGSWDIPGMGIAVVKDDEVVFAKGYGTRTIGKDEPVDENTVFAIGSASKAFTAAAVALLVDEGKMNWDDPVSKYLPDLRFAEAYVDQQMTVRDLLTHRSGLARTDFLWLGQDYTRQEILKRVRDIEPASSFRTAFGYQNVMFLAAGELVPAVTGQSYDEFIHERFFKPLGMTNSSTSITEFGELENLATPHGKVDGEMKVLNWRNIDAIAPAGSINSSVMEMTNWLKLHLNGGKFNGEELIKPASLEELHTPQFWIAPNGEFKIFWMLSPGTNFLTYALGWFVQDYKGRKVIHHGGNIDGMSAQVSFIPSEKLGIVILTNLNGARLTPILPNSLYDFVLDPDGDNRDWSAFARELFDGLEAQMKAAGDKQAASRVKDTKPSLDLKKYAGEYVHKAYGTLKVTSDGDGLHFAFGADVAGDLKHWHFDTFEISFSSGLLRSQTADTKMLATFTLNADAKVEEFKLPMVGTFKKTPEPESPTAEGLETEAEAQAAEEV